MDERPRKPANVARALERRSRNDGRLGATGSGRGNRCDRLGDGGGGVAIDLDFVGRDADALAHLLGHRGRPGGQGRLADRLELDGLLALAGGNEQCGDAHQEDEGDEDGKYGLHDGVEPTGAPRPPSEPRRTFTRRSRVDQLAGAVSRVTVTTRSAPSVTTVSSTDSPG